MILAFVLKVLGFFAAVNLVILPILLVLKIPVHTLPNVYYGIASYEGLCMLIIGGLLVFLSLFSTMERDSYHHIGDAMFKYEVKSRELSRKEKLDLRQKGIVLLLIGFLFQVPTIITFFP